MRRLDMFPHPLFGLNHDFRFLSCQFQIFSCHLSISHNYKAAHGVSTEKQLEMSGSSTAFSSDGAEVISRKIDPINPAMEADLQRQRDLRQYYEIERCSEFIKTHNFQKVAWNGSYRFYFIHTSLSLSPSPPADSSPVSWLLASRCCQGQCWVTAGVCREAVFHSGWYIIWKVYSCLVGYWISINMYVGLMWFFFPVFNAAVV